MSGLFESLIQLASAHRGGHLGLTVVNFDTEAGLFHKNKFYAKVNSAGFRL